MSLANGRTYLAIPGPSAMPDRVLQAMHRPSPNIYEGELVEMMPGIVAGLKAVACTQHNVAIYVGNGHAAWEASLANVFSRGDKALILATGMFSYSWADMVRAMGIEVEIVDFGQSGPIDMARAADILARDAAHEYKAVLCTLVDTATSVKNDIKALRNVLDAVGHPALLMVDGIASIGCDRFEMDAWGVDVAVTGCQKGLMTPAGMSFVFFNDKADAARDSANCVTHYWDWRPRATPDGFWRYFDGTAPTHHLYGLREALAMIAEEGLENVWRRHAVLTGAIWAAVDAWSAAGAIDLQVPNPAARSHAVTCVAMQSPNATRLRQWVEAHTGVTLGMNLGLGTEDGSDRDGYFRIGHMGHVNPHMVLGMLGSVEAALIACEIPHGPGALTAAAEHIAKNA